MKHDTAWLTAAAKGRLLSGDLGAVPRGEVCVDTRLLHRGDVFLALPGTQVDGRAFIADAVGLGADGVIAQAEQLVRLGPGAIAIAVDDPLHALWSIARAQRREFHGHAIAVTGSSGKTSTTAIVASLLASATPTHATRDGFNTHQGVAATLARLPDGMGALVLELAMQARGQIAEKAALLRPTAALITNIGPVHLETAGSLADVARNKAEVIAALPARATCVVPAGERLLEPYLRSDLRVVRHGPGGDVFLRNFTAGVAEIDCGGELLTIETEFSQPHNLTNLIASVALTEALGIRTPSRLAVKAPPLRWQRASIGEIELVLDCFNNSPGALRAALEAFAAEPARRRFAVLGGFGELGEATAAYHRAAGAQAARFGIDAMIVVGRPAREYLAGYGGESYAVQTPEQARSLVCALAHPGDRVLVKGSRHAQLERILA